MAPTLRINEGPVSVVEEHIEITYGSFGTDEAPFPTVALLSPPRENVISLEFLIDDSTSHNAEIIAAVRAHARWLFLEKGEANPWGYACHHCSTAANIYSRINWSWVSTPKAVLAAVQRRSERATRELEERLSAKRDTPASDD